MPNANISIVRQETILRTGTHMQVYIHSAVLKRWQARDKMPDQIKAIQLEGRYLMELHHSSDREIVNNILAIVYLNKVLVINIH
jgi:hypothetical protein